MKNINLIPSPHDGVALDSVEFSNTFVNLFKYLSNFRDTFLFPPRTPVQTLSYYKREPKKAAQIENTIY